MTLTDRQWKNRIRQRREPAARAPRLEERICAALEIRNASLEELRVWLSEADQALGTIAVFRIFTRPQEGFFRRC